MITNILDYMINLLSWQNITALLNSNFTAALAGAFAGAMTAQKISNRVKQRNELLSEIRNINAAIIVSSTICNTGLNLKKQFVNDITKKYVDMSSELKKFQKRKDAFQQEASKTFEFHADLRSLQMPFLSIEILQKQVFENISVLNRPLALVTAISEAAYSLKTVIKKRNELIERFHKLMTEDESQVSALYFGLPFGSGHVSMEFSDNIESLQLLTDDIIFFSELLVKDLISHGENILEQYKKTSKDMKENILSIDFTEPRELGLIPDEIKYIDWLKGFQNK